METILQPETSVRLRTMILGALLVPIVIAPSLSWPFRLLACFVPLMLAGTYRISTIQGEKFRSQLFVAFVPMKLNKCNLGGVMFIETKYHSLQLVGESFPLLVPLHFIFMGLLDRLMPALGGAYEIWLVTAKGRELVAWQGSHEKNFDDNLAILSARSGAEIRARR